MDYPLQPNQEVVDAFWQFTAKRLQVFQARINGQSPPWTDDSIINMYKFCNVYRAADRVSQYLIKDVAYADINDERDRLFNIVAFRTFSRPQTWEHLKSILGGMPTLEHLESGAFLEALNRLRQDETRLYTGAFILCANKAYGHNFKHQNHASLFHDMFISNGISGLIQNSSSLREVYEILHQFPLMGEFMSYQTAIDINYSTLTNHSENEFVIPGPGAVRGLKKLFPSATTKDAEVIIRYLMRHQGEEFNRLGLPFNGLFGRPMHLIDIQNMLCEVDKYTRVSMPHLTSNRTRIKAKFSPTAEPITLFFPPKWGLNDKIPRGKVLGHENSNVGWGV